MNNMDDNDPNAGNSDPGFTPGADPGTQGDQNGSGDQGQGSQGNPGSQNGQQPNSGDAELARMRAENRRLNKALVESRRGSQQRPPSRSPSGQGNQGEPGANAFGTPEEQYAASIQIATNELRGGLEDVFDLYPEIPQTELSRIRRNPWAFATLRSYQTGDFETAKTEIEQYLYDRVEELGKGSVPGQNGQGGQRVPPARVPLNPPAAPAPMADPGSDEDQDPWTMPLNKLEKNVVKEKQKMKSKS